MTFETHQTLAAILREAVDLHDGANISDAEFADRVRGHILNRWYRFTPLVNARAELEKICVEVTWVDSDERKFAAALGHYVDPTRRTTVHLKGTPLENP